MMVTTFFTRIGLVASMLLALTSVRATEFALTVPEYQSNVLQLLQQAADTSVKYALVGNLTPQHVHRDFASAPHEEVIVVHQTSNFNTSIYLQHQDHLITGIVVNYDFINAEFPEHLQEGLLAPVLLASGYAKIQDIGTVYTQLLHELHTVFEQYTKAHKVDYQADVTRFMDYHQIEYVIELGTHEGLTIRATYQDAEAQMLANRLHRKHHS